MPCWAWNSVTSALILLISENRPRCTRVWWTVHSSWVGSLTTDRNYQILLQLSWDSTEVLLMAVSSSRQMPWCTTILGFLESWATSLDMAKVFRPQCHLQVEAFTESALITVSKTPELEKLGNWWLMLCRRYVLDRSRTVLSWQCFPRRSLLLSSRLRNSEV